tara:strand:+ start:1620 stop:4082 length:2463 start_codon:yes stop_codon:yes gene_type:complete
MGLVSRAIPTLLRGISQAADATKQADHADLQDNANSSPVQGLTKRSGSQFVTSISTSTLGNVHVQTINRDTTERYIAIFSNGNVKVYELDGTEKTVNKPDGTTYLNTSNPRDQIKTVTIADFTFVVNTSVTAAMDSSLSPGNITQAVVFVNQVSDKTTYTLTVDGTTATKDTSSDSTLSTTTVATALRTGLSGLSGFTVTQNGAVLRIKKNDGSDFSIDGTDTQGNSHLTVVKDSVQRFTDLPTVSPHGYVVEVKGDETTNFDNYYVKFVANNSTVDGTLEEGQWEETVEAGINFKFDYGTMPHVLIRQADGNFRFARVDGDTYTISGTDFTLPKWGERTVGDLESAPNPSFIGTNINNVFFFRNRLGFLADDNVVLSRVSEFFNFFPETVLTVVDSDPIDVAASHTKVAILKNAVTMGEQLILFSDQTQFVLASSSDSLTPKSANVIVATEFESSDLVAPVGSGSSIYYLTDKGQFAGVREYITQENAAIKDAANITIHVPRLIPANIFKFAVSTNEDVLVLLGSDNPNKLYVNRWLIGDNNRKILNSWSTYTFNANRSIKNIDFIGTDMFIVFEEANKVTLEKIPFEANFRETYADFEYHLDHKVTEATTGVSVSYNSSTDVSTFTVPYRLRAKMTVVGRYLDTGETSTFVDTQGNTKTLKPGQVLLTANATDGSTSTITISGDYRNSKFIIGESYEMHYRFSTQRLTQSSGGSNQGEVISGRLQLRNFYLKFEDTGFFKVEVTPQNRDTSIHKFTGRFLGAASSSIGSINLETGTFKFPVMSRADRVTIDVKNDTFLPTQLASAEYEAQFHVRSRRI